MTGAFYVHQKMNVEKQLKTTVSMNPILYY
jgi:hypothetical protein